jgi:hypothetical protein
MRVTVAVLAACLSAATVRAVQDVPAAPAVDRTARALAAMTPAERSHAKVHSRFSTGTRLVDERVSIHTHEMFVGSPDLPSENVEFDEAQALKCRTDASFIARVVSGRSHPIEDGTYLFTDYTVRIEEAFHAPATRRLQPGDLTTITRPGGTMTIDGVAITAASNQFPALTAGARYLLFVQYLPETKDFVSSQPEGAYQVFGDRLVDTRFVDPQRKAATQGERTDAIVNAVLAKACK